VGPLTREDTEHGVGAKLKAITRELSWFYCGENEEGRGALSPQKTAGLAAYYVRVPDRVGSGSSLAGT
jgi:hypothetical protein